MFQQQEGSSICGSRCLSYCPCCTCTHQQYHLQSGVKAQEHPMDAHHGEMPSQKQGGRNTKGLPELHVSTPLANRLVFRDQLFPIKMPRSTKPPL